MSQRALITGGGRGIGLAITSLFRLNDIEVMAPSRLELDLSSEKSIVNYCSVQSGAFDILINNAGVNPINDFVSLQQTEINETIFVNFQAPFLLTKLLVPAMITQKYGRIINISSIWSVVSKSKRSIYASTKAAINAFTRTLAVELGPHNILVNAVAPGFVNTELTKKNNSQAELKKIAELIPLKRLAEPSEIANLVYFLCSEKNSFITGQTILIDGGYTCQ